MRADAGFPPLVTPSSQIVGTQAVFNVMMGRYKVLTGEFADLMLGYYGETIGQRDRHVIELAAKQTGKTADQQPAGRPAEAGMAGIARRRLGVGGMNGSDEDVLTYAMFPKVAPSSSPPARRVRRMWARTRRRRPAAAAPACSRESAGDGRERQGSDAHHDHLRRQVERQDSKVTVAPVK